jgi:hypothetical protein
VGHSATAPVDTAPVDTAPAVNATAVDSAAIDTATINARIDAAIVSRPTWRIRCISAKLPAIVSSGCAIPEARATIDTASIDTASIDASSIDASSIDASSIDASSINSAPAIHSSSPVCHSRQRRIHIADIADDRMRLHCRGDGLGWL